MHQNAGTEFALGQYRLCLGEGFKPLDAMIVTHSGRSDATKGGFVRCRMEHGVVDAHAAGMGLADNPLLQLLVITEQIQGQRPWSLVDVIYGIVNAVIGDDGQQRAKNFLQF